VASSVERTTCFNPAFFDASLRVREVQIDAVEADEVEKVQEKHAEEPRGMCRRT
jgi:hypothetical protein